jgi:MFS family permease
MIAVPKAKSYMTAADTVTGERRLALAVVIFNAISLFSVGVAPIITADLSSELGLSDMQAGQVLSAEFVGSMLASLPALWWTQKASPRSVALLAAALFLSTNLACAWLTAPGALLAIRALAGLAEGTLIILTLGSAARSPNPTSLYGWWVIGQTVVAAAGLLLFPLLPTRLGLSAIYLTMAVGMLAALPLAWAFDDQTPPLKAKPQARTSRAAAAVLIALLLYYVAAGGAWAFAADRGAELNLTAESVGTILGVAYVVSLGGAALAARLDASQHRRNLTLAGYLATGLSLVLFAINGGAWSLIAFAVTLQFAWACTAPLLMTLVARIEPPGSLMPAATFAIGAGFAVGPLLTGSLFSLTHGPVAVSLALGAILASSAGALLALTR